MRRKLDAAMEGDREDDAVVTALERVTDQLERILELLTEISAKLDTANERLADLNRSQWS